jgi:hypothetical protein
VLAGVRPLEAAHEVEASSAMARIARTPSGLDVEDRPHVQAADGGVGVPGAARAVPGEDLGEAPV